MLQAILFDLDGTLLPMDNDYFVKVYFSLLAGEAGAWGYEDKEKLIGVIWKGVAAMVANDGSRRNAEAFWNCFADSFGKDAKKDIPRFNCFYETTFNRAAEAVSPTKLAREAVSLAHEKAEKVILATNPIFPRCAVRTRLSWIGLTENDFDLVTDYDNSCFCKPNPRYYEDIMEKCALDAAGCIMIGNDVDEDVLASEKAGIRPWLLKDCMINRKDKPVSCPGGSYEEMVDYLRSL